MTIMTAIQWMLVALLFCAIGGGAWWLVSRIPDPIPRKIATYGLVIVGLLLLLALAVAFGRNLGLPIR